ncbi:DUF397 domain-containing protein [Streptomyces beijiangensis]|uniref:DUF397 domain-containing protein n=1 Tax=Streptomyces beijiangensis TaxID=163361 RepID=A0A939FDG3_9ACTN|nr:DUF397 domain-containing protein [Streptomyces beijiangensis]MBO0515993.1 DUF397 domain-containing protein [Streptomyces beijiangensis]
MKAEPNWHTSSYTSTETCVEVADNDPKSIMIRDSKIRGGRHVSVSPAAWAAFVTFSVGAHR